VYHMEGIAQMLLTEWAQVAHSCNPSYLGG
jgi:hypothetical protein